MNTGIGDAVNLAWKLAAVVRGRADASILDSYEPERIAFARRLVATTDRAFTAVTSPGAIARFVRLRLVPLAVPPLFRFRRIAAVPVPYSLETAVSYRGSALSEGRAGKVRGGDRLPWVPTPSGGGEDNFASLNSIDWQVHVYGDASPDVRAECEKRGLALRAFPWRPEMRRIGLRRNALYLVRPDGYVGLAEAGQRESVLAGFLDSRGINAGTG